MKKQASVTSNELLTSIINVGYSCVATSFALCAISAAYLTIIFKLPLFVVKIIVDSSESLSL